MKVSTLVLTLNEERNISACLRALSWCDDIVVLDSGSTDGTVQIAQKFGARVLVRSFDDFAQQRNFGVEHGDLRHEWVLHLDADEIVTPLFAEQLAKLQPGREIDAWRVPSKMMLAGHWLKYAGMYPTYQVRIGHRDRLRFIQVGHGQREDIPIDRIATFPEPYLHYSFSHGIRPWLAKHVQYAQQEAQVLLEARKAPRKLARSRDSVSRRRMLKSATSKIPLWLRPIARIFYTLIVRQGLRDGRAGLAYAMMLAVYEGMIAVYAYDAMLTAKSSAALAHGKVAQFR